MRLIDGSHMVIETKGVMTEQDQAKQAALKLWVEAVNQYRGFGHWRSGVSRGPGEIRDVLETC